ncbi:MAG TPA: ADOP family duplicated permease [Gammaproteobacteria bacterium]
MKTGAGIVSALRRNLRSAGRQYLREPLMSSVAIVSLAVALGAGTYLFGFVNLLLFTPPPGLQDAGRLVDIGRTMEGFGFDTVSYPNYADIAGRAETLDEVYAYTSMPVGLYENDNPARALMTLVTGNYFDALGVVPQAGRLLQPADSRAVGEGAVAVASHGAFIEHLGGDIGRIGESIELNGVRLTLVGVLPAGFNGVDITGSADFYVPLSMAHLVGRSGAEVFEQRRASWLHAGGRLAPGVTLEQANAELASLSRSLQEAYPDTNREMAFVAAPLRMLPAPARLPLMVFAGLLFGLIALVLLVAAGNVAGLLIARGEARRHEIAMRHVLGARRRAIVLQLLTEVLALSLASALLGLLVAWWLRQLVAGLDLPIPLAVDLDAPFDLGVFGFILGLSLFVTVLAGLLPALRVSAEQPSRVLAGTGAQAGNRSRFRSMMVSAQVAFTLLLLILAGLFISALQRAGDVELGYDINEVHAAEIDLRGSRYDAASRRRVIDDVVTRLQRQGGVENAAAARVVPLYFTRVGYGGFLLDNGESIGADANIVSPSFFDTLRIPVRGRGFTEDDSAGGERVVVVNQVLADLLAPEGSVIGRSFRFGDPEDPWLLRVVGVTPDARYSRLDDTNIPFMYLPLSQVDQDTVSIFVRTGAGKRAAERMIGDAVRAADPRLAMPEVESMEDILALSLLPQRVAGGVAVALGALGMLLAALGLYGLLSAYVLGRTRELGVRLTLGASPRALMRAVLWRGLRLVVAGTAAGLVIALLVARALDGFLFGLQAFDAMVFVVTTGLLLGIGVLALLAPARRVLAIQPQEALRHE